MGAFQKTGSVAFIRWMLPNFTTYIHHMFSDLQVNRVPVSLLLFFLPLALLLFRRKRYSVLLGLFYVCMWLSFFVVASVMKKLPFERNLTGHYSLTLACVLLLCYELSDLLAGIGKAAWVKMSMLTCILLLFGMHFLRSNPVSLKDTLYEYDVNGYYKDKVDWLRSIPAGSTVACSDEDFYSGYLCKLKGCSVSKCPDGEETYFIKEAFEYIPLPYAEKYVLAKKYYGNEIWILK